MTKRRLILVIMVGFGLRACGGSTSDVAAFCRRIDRDHRRFADPTATTAGRAELRNVISSAPRAIRGDLKTLVDYADSATVETPKSEGELAKLARASKNVGKYVKAHCRIGLTSTT